MSRSLRYAATAAALLLLIGAGCKKKNSAPEAPSITGPTSARPADTLSYHFNSTDPDGDSVFFMISWGDGASSQQWSPAIASGVDYTQAHVYTDSGTYYITAKAKDGKDAESALSDSFRVTIGSFPPDAPVRPSGPSRCSTGVAYTWSTKALHPLHDSVRIQFSWGDGTIDSFARMVASNALFDTTHTYSLPGKYKIAARARDAKGFESPWSESLLVSVDTAPRTPRGAPHGLVLTAATDSTVHIAWLAPTDSTTPLRYVIIFTETRSSHSDSVGGADSLGFVHDPAHRTGRYQVAAVYASGRVTSSESPSTTPASNGVQSIPELSVPGVNTGYGWERATGHAALHDMTSADTASLVDFYITDFAPGFAGPNYAVASPFLAPQDPGGAVPHSIYWRLNTFGYLDSTATEEDPLPRYIQSRYRDSTVLDSFPILIACHTEDNYFALIKATSIDTANGTADVESWFQKIPGLRLIEH